MKRFISYVVGLILLAGCVKDSETIDPDFGFDYYPDEVGRYWVYRVDSTYHDHPDPEVEGVHETVSYQVKEVFSETFEDNEGREALRIERFKRPNEDAEWQIADIWMAVKTNRRVEKVEENVRFIKLAFPVDEFESWDGNALNTLEMEEYEYDSIGQPLSIEDVNFNETLTVKQEEEINAVRREVKYEKYARGVGMVEKYFLAIDTRIDYISNPSEDNIRNGVEYRYTLLDYGVE